MEWAYCRLDGGIVVIESQVKTLEELATNLVTAVTIREKVRLADRIFAALGECEKLVEQFIVNGMTMAGNASHVAPPAVAKHVQPVQPIAKSRQIGSKQFRDVGLADVARELLSGVDSMHGVEIERLAKAGGFESDAKHFQSYLSVALKRKGGFENIGKNRWRLNDKVPPQGRERGAVAAEAKQQDSKPVGVPRKIQLHNWLRENGPATRDVIVKQAGLPEGSASSIMSVEKALFQKREDGLWHAL